MSAGVTTVLRRRESPRTGGFEERPDTRAEPVRITELALPDHEPCPAELPELPGHLAIAGAIGVELGLPECRSRSRGRAAASAPMPVPEAAVHEDHPAQPWKDQIGSAGNVLRVESETESECVAETADDEFGTGMSGTDRRHVPAPLGGSEDVTHRREAEGWTGLRAMPSARARAI